MQLLGDAMRNLAGRNGACSALRCYIWGFSLPLIYTIIPRLREYPDVGELTNKVIDNHKVNQRLRSHLYERESTIDVSLTVKRRWYTYRTSAGQIGFVVSLCSYPLLNGLVFCLPFLGSSKLLTCSCHALPAYQTKEQHRCWRSVASSSKCNPSRSRP